MKNKNILITSFFLVLFCLSSVSMNFSYSRLSDFLNITTIPGSSNPTGTEWPMFMGNLNHTGVTNTTPIGNNGPFWNTAVDIFGGSSPVISNGLIYVGSNDSLYCLNATSGVILWNYTTGNSIISSPSVSNGLVYIGSYDDNIYCFNATSGSLNWSYLTGNMVGSSPSVYNGRVYVGSLDGYLYCLYANNGTLIWKDLISPGLLISPTITNGVLYVGGNSAEYCLNTTDGTTLWSYPMGCISTTAISGNFVYYGGIDNNTYCLNASSGKFVWKYSTDNYIMCSPAIDNGRVYIGNFNDIFYCLNATDGSSLWNFTTGSMIASSAAIANGMLYFGSMDGYLYCLNEITGSLLWSYEIMLGESSPTIVNGMVYAAGMNYLYCLPMIMPPSAPINLNLSQGNGTIGLTWWSPLFNGGSAVTGYNIYRGTSSGTETLLTTVGNVFNYTDIGLTNGQTYFYEVTAVNSVGESQRSSEASIAPATTPAAPTNIQVTRGDTELILNWNAPSGNSGLPVTGYNIYRGTSSGSEALITTLGNVTIYTDTGLTNGQTYFYEVSAKNSLGEGVISNEESGIPAGSPTQPENVQIIAGSEDANLTWSPPTDNGGLPITGYNIYRGTSSGSEIFLATVGNVTNFNDTGLINGQTYYYEVSANNSNGAGSLSNEVNATPKGASEPPGNLKAVAGNQNVTLTWSIPSSNGGYSITGYYIYRGTSSGSEILLTTIGNVTSFNDTGLTNGQTYYYEVSANNSFGESLKSNECSSTPATNPGAPTILQIKAGNENVNFSWQVPSNNGGSPITGYNIYRGTSSGSLTLLTTSGNVTNYVDTGLTNTQIYYYQVSAINSIGEGSLSSEVNATPKGVSTPPENLQTVTTPNNVTLTWSIPSNNGGYSITGYYIYRGTSSGSETLLTTVGTVTSYTDTRVTSGQTYYYEVSANNSFGESQKSNECFTTIATVPGTPKNLQIKAGNNELILSWQAPSNNGGSPIIGYKIYRGTTSGKEIYITTVGNVTTYTNTGLTSGQTYYYTVCAINKAGDGPQSAESSAIPTSSNSIGGVNIAGILLFSFLGLVVVVRSMSKRP